MDEKTTYTDEAISIALSNLNKRLQSVEGKVNDYTADMVEVYRNLGVLTKRLTELESKVEELICNAAPAPND